MYSDLQSDCRNHVHLVDLPSILIPYMPFAFYLQNCNYMYLVEILKVNFPFLLPGLSYVSV